MWNPRSLHRLCYSIHTSSDCFRFFFTGIDQFLKLGIPADKLVLGLPWYGYDYPCIHYTPVRILMGRHSSFHKYDNTRDIQRRWTFFMYLAYFHIRLVLLFFIDISCI